MTGSCVYVWLSMCTQSSSRAVRWHQLKEHASSLSVSLPSCLPRAVDASQNVVKESSCMFTFRVGWGPAPDHTTTVYFRVWVKTMLLWQRLISDGWSLAGWGCSLSWSSTVSVSLLWHSYIWGIGFKIKWGTKMVSLGMTGVRSHAWSQPWWVVSKS